MDEIEARQTRAFGLLLSGCVDMKAALDELKPPPDSPMGHLHRNIEAALQAYHNGERDQRGERDDPRAELGRDRDDSHAGELDVSGG